MDKAQKIKLSLILIGLCLSLFFIYLINQYFDKGTIAIRGNRIKVETMTNENQWTQGLSGRDNLEKNSGMLFIYPDKAYRSFWMKDMKFAIDIIWITDNKIVGIEKNVPIPQTVPIPTYQSPKPVNYVLEVNANYSDQHHLEVGDNIIFNLK